MRANDHQVAGDHYRTDRGIQHWDLVHMFNLDYFQGQITKYVLRWKYKHNTPAGRLEDLKKARHFLDKYIEIHEQNAVAEEMPKIDRAPNPFWKNDPLHAGADPCRGYVNQG